MATDEPPQGPPRIEYLKVRNYRALREVELKGIRPLTVLLGPNGSGKSTLFDVLAFLAECFQDGVRRAWDRRGRFRELRSRGSDGPVEFTLKYRESRGTPLITYHLAIDEALTGPVVAEEWLKWRRGRYGKPFKFLDFSHGSGDVVSGERPDEEDERVGERLDSAEVLAVNALGQLARNPRVAALRRFVTGWHLSYLTAESTRSVPEAGPQEHLSRNGDNLPNVIQYLSERHSRHLEAIFERLARRVPRLERVTAEAMADGRLLLQLKDAPFERPVMAKFASDGTLKMLAYLTVLHDPEPQPLVGIEEPENHLHPRLLWELAEECQVAADRSQLLVTTHSPYFVNALTPDEVWVLYRDQQGFTQARRTSELPRIREFVAGGSQLGWLWMEGFFGCGDPLSEPDPGLVA